MLLTFLSHENIKKGMKGFQMVMIINEHSEIQDNWISDIKGHEYSKLILKRSWKKPTYNDIISKGNPSAIRNH